VEVAFGTCIPDTVVVPEHSTPWRAFCDAYFARDSVVVWKASRGFGGKSYLLAILGLTEALTLKADVKILGGSGAQSKNVQDYISDDLYNAEHCPRWLWDGEPLTTVSRFTHGNSIQALMASSKSVRGPHPQRLRLDEVDEMSVDLFDAAMGQPMAKVEGRRIVIPSQTVCSSTHHYPDKTMTEVLKRARSKGWPIHEWSYHETSCEDGWLLESQIEEKKRDTSNRMWEVEYDLQEPVAEGRAILTEWVDATFDAALGSYRGAIGEYIEIEKPQRGARYATGADWAKKQDYTVIATWRTDVHPYRLVAFERRQREPWPRMVGRFDKRVKRFRGKALHDATGLGSVIEDYKTSRSGGVVMVGSRRRSLFSNYIAAMEDGAFIAPDIEWMRDEHKYCESDDLYRSGKSNHPPDSVVAGALAYEATLHGGGRGT
jgi:hypothetical protein